MHAIELVELLETRRLLASFTASSVAELVSDVNAANAAGGVNSITLAAGTTFDLKAVDNQNDFGSANGLPIIAAGDDLTILGNGATIQRSTARGTPNFRLFDVAAGASLALNDLTLAGGVALFSGGAVQNAGTLSLHGVTVQNCMAKGWSFVTGGGIISNGTLTIADSTIRSNQAIGDDGWLDGFGQAYIGGHAFGGGLYVSGGTATITNSTFASNTARGGNGADGYSAKGKFGPRVVLAGGLGGTAWGGGIYAAGGSVTLTGTTITANSAAAGIGGTSPKGLPKGADGTAKGGGIYISSASVVLDAFTRANTRSNTASTSDNDIFGSFSILP